MSARARLALVVLTFAGVGTTGWILARTAFAATIPLEKNPPPLAVSRAKDLAIRSLPNPEAEAVGEVDRDDLLYIRCVDGTPLLLGPYVGVVAAKNSAVGWVHGRFISNMQGTCASWTPRPPTWRLRKRSVAGESMLNVRFGPSPRTVTVGKVRPGADVWTDGRYADVDGYRWVPVMLKSGVTGWIRGDLLQ